jgi:hypothetical protein
MNNINTSLKKIYSLLILTFLFFLILINTTLSEEKIGSIVSLKNEVFAINVDGEKRLLDLYDAISLQDEIVTNELSTATVQYNDNSTIIIKKSSSFKVTDFNITGLKGVFLGKVQKGSVIIESGKIAKEDNGSMVIELPKMTLGIKGTRFNIENNPDGTSAVSLAADSFGNVGTINISSEGKVKTLFDTEQVVSTNAETGFSERAKTDDEKKELVDASNDLIEASSIDENVIQKNLEEKLLNGSLLDANGDGKIDTLDVEVIKEGIKLEKQGKIDFIVSNSSFGNTDFLSNVLNNSDEISTGQSMNKIFETKNDLVVSVMTNLSNGDNRFITTSEFEVNNIIKEKIYNQMLENNNNENNNINIIANIMSKSDVDTIEKMVGYVEVLDVNSAGSNFSLQVLSSLADVRTQNNVIFEDEKQTQVNRLIEEAVASAGNNAADSMMLANVMTKSDVGTIGIMVDNIQLKGQSDPNSNFSLQVLSSVADMSSQNLATFETEEQNQVNRLIEEAVASAANSDEGTKLLANVFTNGDVETISLMVDSIQDFDKQNSFQNQGNDTETSLSLKILSSVADSNFENNTSFETAEQTQVNKLIEVAVANAGNNAADSAMLANVITKSDAATVGTMLNNIVTVSAKDPNSTLAAQVLSSVATTAAINNTYFDTEKMNQFNDLVNTVAFTNTTTTAEDDEAVALALATATATLAEEDAAAALTTATTTEEDDATFLYDASGFAFAPPYYHKDTGTMYNNDGLDRNGNSQVVVATNPTWTVQPTFAETYTTSQNINTTATATSSPATNGITYSATGLPAGVDISPTTGAISGSPTDAGDYSGTVKAEDSEDSAKSISLSFSFEVTVTYNAQGFSTTYPFNHQNGTAFNPAGRDYQGYNSAGFNSAGYDSSSPPIYNSAYDVSPA